MVLLETLGQLWLAGVEIDWPRFHAGEPRRRVALPTYPFERRRYWIERATGAPEPARSPSGLYLPSFRRTAPLPPPADADLSPEAGGWLILADRAGLGETLAERLRGKGAAVALVIAGDRFSAGEGAAYTVDPRQPGDYAALLSALAAKGPLPTRIVHLWTLDPRRMPRAPGISASTASSPWSTLWRPGSRPKTPAPWRSSEPSSWGAASPG